MRDSIKKQAFYNEINFPESVRKKKGVSGAETLIGGEGELVLTKGSYVIYDMGAESVGGYPVFNVKSFEGNPLLHISYSDRITPFEKEKTMLKGDFIRNSCGYLGIELPVMPANPHRFEDYRISRLGEYSYPLIQGQERFVFIGMPEEKNSENESVTLSDFYIRDNSVAVSPVGYFKSDNEETDRLWLASARTLRLATVCSRQWEKVGDRIALRKLTFSDEGAVFKNVDCKKISLKAEAEIYLNPTTESGLGILLFSDGNDGYKLDLCEDGTVTLSFGEEKIAKAHVKSVGANKITEISADADSKQIVVFINGEKAIEFNGRINTGKSFGFYMRKEWRASLLSVQAVCDGKEIAGVFEPENYGIRSVGYFISDGAKRDRLPWTGDLFWALDGAWYAFGRQLDPINTFDILAFHQNEEGFIFGTCYPENSVKPKAKEYGYYQSDAFAVWFVVSVLVYIKASGDDRAEKFMPAMRRCMDYIWRYVDTTDWLFIQRYETSKGLWDHDLGESGKITYTNMLISDAYTMLAEVFEEAGDSGYANICAYRGKKIKKGIIKHLYDGKAGGFIKKKGLHELCDLANPYAMARGFAIGKRAKNIARNASVMTRSYGKIVALMARGLYDNGYTDAAEKLLFGKTPCYDADGKFFSFVDWVGTIDNADLPETVYECMHNPPYDFGDNLNWGDLAHPDSVINGVISAYVAGIRNIGKGFDKILLKPNPYKCKRIVCGVPTRLGLAETDIMINDDGSFVSITVPKGTKVKTDFSALPKPVKYSVKYKE